MMPSSLRYNLHGNRSCELGSYALDDTVADKDKVQSQRAQNHGRGTCYFPNICRHTPQETSAPTGAFSAQMTSASLGTPARSLWKWHWNSANVWEGGFLVNLSWFNGPSLRIFCYLYINDLSRIVSYQTFGCLVRWTESLERVSHQNKRMHDQKFKFIFLHVFYGTFTVTLLAKKKDDQGVWRYIYDEAEAEEPMDHGRKNILLDQSQNSCSIDAIFSNQTCTERRTGVAPALWTRRPSSRWSAAGCASCASSAELVVRRGIAKKKRLHWHGERRERPWETETFDLIKTLLCCTNMHAVLWIWCTICEKNQLYFLLRNKTVPSFKNFVLRLVRMS